MRSSRFMTVGGVLLATFAQAKDEPSSPTATITSLASTVSPGLATTKAPTLVSGCAAAVSTTSICSTCVTAACVYEETMTVSCGCPSPAVTIFASHPCDLGCDDLGCGTITKVVTEACPSRDGTGKGTLTKPGTLTEPGPDVDTTPAPTGASGSGGPSTTATAVETVVTNGGGRVAPFRFW